MVGHDSLVANLRSGAVVVLRTETLYGILARAGDKETVERIYALKGRNATKPFIVLISRPEQAYDNANLLEQYAALYSDYPTSIIIEAPSAPDYLRRGGTNLACRLETNGLLHDIIERTGPLVAPSANPEGQPPAKTVAEARAYFGDAIDLYIDGGTVPAHVQASRIMRVNQDGTVERLR